MAGTSLAPGLLIAAAGCYAVSAICSTGAWTGRRAAVIGARASLASGVVLVTLALARAWLADGHLPLFDVPGAGLTLVWAASLVYLGLDRAAAVPALGPVVLPVVLLLFAAAGLLAWRGAGGAPAAPGWLLGGHVLAAMAAYAAFLFAFGGGVLYLVQDRQLRRGSGAGLADRLPPLATLDRLTYGALLAGLPLLTLALLVGLSQARGAAWGELFGDPTVAASLCLWGFYAAVLVLRGTARVRGRKVAWLTIGGFAAVLGTFLGTSWLGPGNHPTSARGAPDAVDPPRGPGR